MNTIHTRIPLTTVLIMLFVSGLLIGACSSPPIALRKLEGHNPELVRLGKAINSENDEFAPLLNPNASVLYLTSDRPLKGSDEEIHHLFESRRTDQGLGDAQFMQLGPAVENKAGAVSYDFSRNQVIFVQCYMPDGFGDCDLYVADIENGEWKNVRNLGPEINSIEWDAHPSISRDGNTLYFASERGGNSDIYVSTRSSGGSWTDPQNLGEPVNTGGDEKSPFISSDGRSLYFSSDDHSGYGGLDLFVSEKKASGWSEPLNLGVPYNSIADDVFLTTPPSGDTTYLASNRVGGLGGYDIYEIRNVALKPPPPPKPEVKPLIVRYTIKNAFTGQPIHAQVTYAPEGRGDIDMQAFADGIVQHEVLAGLDYGVTASAAGYENGVDNFTYPPNSSGIRDRVLMLTPIREEERKIYAFVVEFDFDLFNIRPEEKKKLDTAAALLTEFPSSTVVVSGHTDSMGTESYNIKLGYNRADAVGRYVERYMKQKGVRLQNKLAVRTYGETQPIDTNGTDEGRQRNRRVEIAIVRNE